MTCLLPAMAMSLVLTGTGFAADAGKSTKEESSFGALRSTDAAEARKQAETWLASVGKADAASAAQLKTIWDGDAPILEKTAATLALGDARAATLLKDARVADAAPTETPAVLKDKAAAPFLRNNLALAYAKALVTRKVYEEALDVLSLVKVEDVIDPSSYLFHKAVCEYELMLKDKADRSIDRLLVDATDSPERYRMVAALMHFDMITWKEKDLGWIARKMENIQRRLDLQRGGKKTQGQQKEVLVRLDEMIKEIENQQKNSGGS